MLEGEGMNDIRIYTTVQYDIISYNATQETLCGEGGLG